MVSRRVNAILEATPMHLITSYFEHAYEMPMDEDEDGFESCVRDETLNKLEALLGHPDLLASGDTGAPTIPAVESGSSSAQTTPSVPWPEDPADVLARVRDMAGEAETEAFEERPDLAAPPLAPCPTSQGKLEGAASVLGREQAMAASPQSPLTQPFNPKAEEARDVLARVQAMLEDPAPASSTAPLAGHMPPEHGHLQPRASLASKGQEDASLVLVRVQEWMRQPPACGTPTSGTPMSMPVSAMRADAAREDAASVVARANRWLSMGAIPGDTPVDRGIGGGAGRRDVDGGADVPSHLHATPGLPVFVQKAQSVACTCAESVESAACACANSGASKLVRPARPGGVAAREDPAHVLARVRGMVVDDAMDTSPTDSALLAAARPRLGTKPGHWAWERTPDTCCAWEKRLVMQAAFEH